MPKDMTVLFTVVFFWISEPLESTLAEFLPVLLSLLSTLNDPLVKSFPETLTASLEQNQADQTNCNREQVLEHVIGDAP